MQGVDAYVAEARARGGEVVESISDRPTGMREFVVTDRGGNMLTFGETLRRQLLIPESICDTDWTHQ